MSDTSSLSQLARFVGQSSLGSGDAGDHVQIANAMTAMALKPRVLLLDEPAAGVPSGEAAVIHGALARLPAEMAILLIEHDMDLVFRFATEIVVLVQGSVLSRCTPEQTRADPRVRSAYLGSRA